MKKTHFLKITILFIYLVQTPIFRPRGHESNEKKNVSLKKSNFFSRFSIKNSYTPTQKSTVK